MAILILTETAAGYALFKASKDVLKSAPEQIPSLLKLKRFEKFDSAAVALEEVDALVQGKVSEKLARLLDGEKGKLAVADLRLAKSIGVHPGLNLKLVSESGVLDIHRAIREHLVELLPGLSEGDLRMMNLGLSHSMSRHRLKFSPDKIDTMIIQAIGLLDDLDKEVNVYVMRLKEWYGWHFPELARIVVDGVAFARVVNKMGERTNAEHTDLSEILPEELESQLKAAAEISMGTEIAEEDLEHMQYLATQVIDLAAYRTQLSTYLTARMNAIAPNLTTLVGDLVGARLIAHAGSLMSLAKAPASTVQILGAEKALFRALKTKHDTPKYGLIYHASLIGQASNKNKGKIARLLATKTALSVRFDALCEDESSTIGLQGRQKVEARLFALEGIQPRVAVEKPTPAYMERPSKAYNPAADAVMTIESSAAADSSSRSSSDADEPETQAATTSKKRKHEDESKEEKKRRKQEEKSAKKEGKAAKKDEKAAKKMEKAARKEEKRLQKQTKKKA